MHEDPRLARRGRRRSRPRRGAAAARRAAAAVLPPPAGPVRRRGRAGWRPGRARRPSAPGPDHSRAGPVQPRPHPARAATRRTGRPGRRAGQGKAAAPRPGARPGVRPRFGPGGINGRIPAWAVPPARAAQGRASARPPLRPDPTRRQPAPAVRSAVVGQKGREGGRFAKMRFRCWAGPPAQAGSCRSPPSTTRAAAAGFSARLWAASARAIWLSASWCFSLSISAKMHAKFRHMRCRGEFIGLRILRQPLEEPGHRDRQHLGDLEQPAGGNAVQSTLIFVSLLIGNPDHSGELLLRKAHHYAPFADACSHVPVGGIGALADFDGWGAGCVRVGNWRHIRSLGARVCLTLGNAVGRTPFHRGA